MAPERLLDRDAEVESLDRLLTDVTADARGAGLVIRGAPGLGKTALLRIVAQRAADRGWRVLRTDGTPAEMRLPLAALHKLVRSLLAEMDQLPAAQRAVLHGAFGLVEAPRPEMFQVAMATLDLLAEVATHGPVAVLVDDAHWLDRSSAEVLAFIARRLESDPIVLLAAARSVEDGPMADGGLPELVLDALDETSSAALLESVAPTISWSARRGILTAAAGNPLALVELPKAVAHAGDDLLLPGLLPMTTRLERAFAARAAGLPATTRDLLLICAVHDCGTVTEVLAAGTLLNPGIGIGDLDTAAAAGLVDVDQTAVRFRHPLVRSAVHQSAGLSRRHAAHAALARVLTDDVDRRAWHRAASVVGTDEQVAMELEQAAVRAQHRGAVAAAVQALKRSAELSGEQATRGRRLLGAAELAYEVGHNEQTDELLADAGSLDLDPADRLRCEWIRELSDRVMRGGAQRIDTLIALAGQARARNDRELAAQFLLRAATRCWHLSFAPEVERRVLAATDLLGLGELDPRRLVIQAYAAPFERGAEIIELLARRAPRYGDDPHDLLLLGHAAACIGAFAQAEIFCTAAADGLREQGRLALLCQALSLLAWAALRRSRWHVALPAAEECVRFAQETRQPIVQATGLAAQAMMAGVRGDEQAADALSVEAERLALADRNTIGLAIVQVARSISDAGAGRPSEAYEQLRRIYRSTDPAHHRMQACWALGSLAEVAAPSGHRHEAVALLAEFDAAAAGTPSAGIQVALRYARAMLAEPDEVDERFGAALGADLRDWPFEHGRLLLAYGGWLRRRQRVSESRELLRAAREEFDRIGALPWAARARQELRAAGESSSGPAPDAWDNLSPQEMKIAQLVAEGLGNKEIGQRLYLSHRTVGSHLYRIFPKLGVSSRAQLARAIPAT